jgi:ABC-2 type transport system ATP-binding protein
MDRERILEVNDLVVEYKTRGGRVRAVDGVTFGVARGECVGFIGPNGAGKSSAIKTMMGFIFPVSGSVRLFGQPAGTVESKLRIGYLPEVTLYYPFLKATELLRLYGGLQRVPAAVLRERIPRLLAEVGLDGQGNVLIRNYSKGMQQRLGIAQALIAEPECLIFDELSSGLDPVGRHDLRRVLLDLKAHGTTIFFSSHELYEVEALCDRVVAIHKGRLLFDLPLDELRRRAGSAGLEEYFMSLVRGGAGATQ